MNDKVSIQVIYVQETEVGSFQDALYFSLEEYNKISQEEIDNKKKERVDAWIEFINNPPPEIEISKEELLDNIQDLIRQRVHLQDNLLENYELTKEELQLLVDIVIISKESIETKIEEDTIKDIK